MSTVYPPGVDAPLHHHPVPGLLFIVRGVAESAYGNDAPKLYRTGDTLQDFAGVPHTLFRNPSDTEQLEFLVFANLKPGQSYVVVP